MTPPIPEDPTRLRRSRRLLHPRISARTGSGGHPGAGAPARRPSRSARAHAPDAPATPGSHPPATRLPGRLRTAEVVPAAASAQVRYCRARIGPAGSEHRAQQAACALVLPPAPRPIGDRACPGRRGRERAGRGTRSGKARAVRSDRRVVGRGHGAAIVRLGRRVRGASLVREPAAACGQLGADRGGRIAVAYRDLLVVDRHRELSRPGPGGERGGFGEVGGRQARGRRVEGAGGRERERGPRVGWRSRRLRPRPGRRSTTRWLPCPSRYAGAVPASRLQTRCPGRLGTQPRPSGHGARHGRVRADGVCAWIAGVSRSSALREARGVVDAAQHLLSMQASRSR